MCGHGLPCSAASESRPPAVSRVKLEWGRGQGRGVRSPRTERQPAQDGEGGQSPNKENRKRSSTVSGERNGITKSTRSSRQDEGTSRSQALHRARLLRAPHALSSSKADAVTCSLKTDTPGVDLRTIKSPLLAHAALITETIFRESEPPKNHEEQPKDCEH